MKRTLASLALAIGLVASGTVAASAGEHVSARPWWMKHACAQEDSVNCFWDASHAGNHRGHSFIVREMPGKKHMVCVMYIKRADARRWDYCS